MERTSDFFGIELKKPALFNPYVGPFSIPIFPIPPRAHNAFSGPVDLIQNREHSRLHVILTKGIYPHPTFSVIISTSLLQCNFRLNT